MFKGSPQTLGDVVDWGLCIGCGACAFACTRGSVKMVHVESEGFRPTFEDPACHACTECLPICPGAGVKANSLEQPGVGVADVQRELGRTLEIWQGWATDPEIRFKASSGGLLSALSLYCIERKEFTGVIHAGMDPVKPWMNRNYISTNRADILARTGSRYAPSAPVSALGQATDGTYVFVGKPCDVGAVAELVKRDANVRRRVGLTLTFFCAGTPSTRGTLDLMDGLDVPLDRLGEVHYRGDGWPGSFRAVTRDGEVLQRMSYVESWQRLTSYRPLRCNLCPDGLGRLSDLACGDAWNVYSGNGDAGQSIVLVRTERGREFLEGARRAGYIAVRRIGAQDVFRAQVDLLHRRRELFGRLTAFRVLGVPTPTYEGFSLFRSWLKIGPVAQAKSVAGTMRRILQRGWFRRRIRPVYR